MKHLPLPLLLSLLVSLLTGCHPSADTQAVTGIKPFATLQELMLSVVDPHVDPIWNAVSTTVTQQGVEEKAPATDAEWTLLRQHAIALIEAGNLLQLPHREVAVVGSSTSIHPVEQDPKAIQHLIESNQADFSRKAKELQEAAKYALIAIDNKDAEGLLKAGEGIEKACESCHSTYWYPNDTRPVTFKTLDPQGASAMYSLFRRPRADT